MNSRRELRDARPWMIKGDWIILKTFLQNELKNQFLRMIIDNIIYKRE